MSDHKFDVGDVVRLNHGSFKENDGTLATVKSVRQTDGSPYDVLKLETVGGWRLEVWEYMVVGVPLEEVQRYYADKPRRGFIVDGLTVDELESGQDEAYQTFRTAANEANREEEQRAAEENRKDRRALAELTVMSIMWVVFTFVSLAMWLVVMWTGETACAPIGYYSALVSVVAVVKPMYALILVCREQIKERQRGRRHNIK
jgi:hypothetical protein